MKHLRTYKTFEKNTIKGGKSDNLSVEDIAKKFNVPVSKIKNQLELGIKVESEHTDSKEQQREIAMDHLAEIPDYYDRLKKMEDQGEKTFEEIHIHDRWEQQSIEEDDIKQFVETLFVNLLDDGFTVDTSVIYSEYSQVSLPHKTSGVMDNPKKYVELRIRNVSGSAAGDYGSEFLSGVKYSYISNEVQTFVDYMKRKWKIIDVTYEYEELLPDENIGAYTKVIKKSKEPSKNAEFFNGKFNLTIKQLDKEPNMFQRFIKRF
jgi:hypothetical protein